MSQVTPKRSLAAIMFADIVGYTAMMQENEQNALVAREKHKSVIQTCVPDYDGQVIQYYGDGALSIFPSAKQAVLAAADIQSRLRSETCVPVRIGIHLGEIVRDQDGIYGDCVNLASRIESAAVPGSVLLSEKVYQELANHPEINCVSYGKFRFKNVNNPIGIYALKSDRLVVPGREEVVSEKGERIGKTIAILQFSDSGDHEDYFAEGLSEEIIHGLTLVDGLSVISQTTTAGIQAAGEQKLVKALGLGVSHLLTGRVRRVNNKVRVSVQLTRTDDGYQVWGGRYDRELDDLFDVQDDIARQVIHALKINFDLSAPGQEVIEKPTQNMEAYTLYLKGMHHWHRRNPEDVTKAIGFFNDSLEIDKEYASAQCALSQCYTFMGSCGAIPPADAYARAMQHAMTAIENNPDLADAHLAMANIRFFNFWDWDGARISLEKAESLGLNTAMFYQVYGLYYGAIGEAEKGIQKLRKALELDPLSIPVLSTLGTLLLFGEKYDEAIGVFEDILELEPTFRSVIQYKGIAYLCQGRLDEAIQQLEEYHRRVNHPQKGIAGLAMAHHWNGETEKAQIYVQRIRDRYAAEPSAAVEIDLAIVYAGTGAFEEAVQYLESVYAKRLSIACLGMIWIIRCPCFSQLWEYPGYHALLAKMGL